jgi:diguanylate cyclase
VAERIRLAIESSVTEYEDKKLDVTCSIGISQFEASDDAGRLIRRADDALYASKKAGRNCGHWQNDGKCVPLNAPLQEEAVETDSSQNSASATGRATSPGAFVDILKRRVAESHRFGLPLSVMHLKIDEYEVIKEKYGFAIARQIVDTATPALEKVLQDTDVLARLEPGELVVMLPGKTQSEAGLVVKKMRAAVRSCILPMLDRELQIKFSDGIAQLKPNETPQELLLRARQAAIPATAVRQPAEV